MSFRIRAIGDLFIKESYESSSPMCLTFYLASSAPLAEIAPVDGSQPFYCELVPDPLTIAALTLPYKYFLGAHTGCGCGFNFGIRDNGDNDTSTEDTKASRDALTQYLTHARSQGHVLELFCCWTGDESKPPRVSQNMIIPSLADMDFAFHKRTRYLVQ
jgi:hypothetical protein